MSNNDPNDNNNDPNEIRRRLRENLEKFKRQRGETDSDSSDSGSSKQNTNKDSWNDQDNYQEQPNEDKRKKSGYGSFFKKDGNNDNSDDWGSNNGNNFKMPSLKLPNFNGKLVGLTAALIILIPFVISGFYTINEQDKGVVTRFGQYVSTSQPGLNWRTPIIEQVKTVNVSRVNELLVEEVVLTRDENVVNVSMNVQYQINDPRAYLFNVDNPEDTLRQATESSLRYVIGHMDMDQILTTGRSEVRSKTIDELRKLVQRYDAGIEIKSLNFQYARPPEEVKEAFDDAIKAQEDEERFKREAEAYKRSQEPIARGNAQQIVYQAQAYAQETLARAEGLAVEFNDLLPAYLNNPNIFKQRYYLETMAKIYGVTPKVILEDGIQLNFLNLDNLLNSMPPVQEQPSTVIPYTPSRMAVDPNSLQRTNAPVTQSKPSNDTDSNLNSSNSYESPRDKIIREHGNPYRNNTPGK